MRMGKSRVYHFRGVDNMVYVLGDPGRKLFCKLSKTGVNLVGGGVSYVQSCGSRVEKKFDDSRDA